MNLAEQRKRLDLTQDELGELLGMTRRNISYIETGRRPLQKQTALAVECLLRRAGMKVNRL